MSAKNWSECPRCAARNAAAQTEKKVAADDAYGKVPRTEYLVLRRVAEMPIQGQMSLREGYHIGVQADGEFSVTYDCLCNTCGFEFEYKHRQRVEVGK